MLIPSDPMTYELEPTYQTAHTINEDNPLAIVIVIALELQSPFHSSLEMANIRESQG